LPEQPRPGPRAAQSPDGRNAGWWRRHRQAKRRRLAKMSTGKRILRRIGLLATWLLALFALLSTVLVIGVYSVVHVPSPDELKTNQTATLQYADGSTMATIDGGENRTSVPLSKVPVYVRDAVLAAEDRGFYSEPGISVRGTLRAAVNDVKGGSTQGGSTITQQYVKNAYLNSDQTLGRKLKELAISLKLSRQYSKDDILENYLNTIYFGRSAYGIQAAANAYFGVSVDKVNRSQGALLAAVIKSPEYYDPAATPAAARDRWTYVVDGMVSTGKLTPEQRAALRFPATIKVRTSDSALDGPLGLVWRQVKAEMTADGIDPASINTQGLRIKTTIDRSAQKAAQDAITQTFADRTPQQKNLRPALAAIDPANGGVLAYYGGSSGTGFDYANGYRPPGSSFKPYTLATALTQNVQGKKPAYALSSTFDGSYQVVINGTTIQNDPGDEQYSGRTTLAFAMKASLNTTFDGLANVIGPPNVAATAHAMGIAKERVDNGKPTLVNAAGQTTFGIGIGDSDYAVRPLDQAVGFATIADGGVTHRPHFVRQVSDNTGKVVYRSNDAGDRSLDPKVANDVGLAVKPVADWSARALADGRESGSKTGTAGIQGDQNGNNSDAWMVGYTPQVSAAVWVGSGKTQPIFNANGNPEYGRDLPGSTWKLFMDNYLAGKPKLPLPSAQLIGEPAAPTPTYTPSPSVTQSSVAPSTSAAPSSTPPTTSAAPSSSAPVSSAPVSSAPVSSAPASSAPVSSAPVSSAPVSSAPVSSAPASSAPVSSAPPSTSGAVSTPPPSTTSSLPAPPSSSARPVPTGTATTRAPARPTGSPAVPAG